MGVSQNGLRVRSAQFLRGVSESLELGQIEGVRASLAVVVISLYQLVKRLRLYTKGLANGLSHRQLVIFHQLEILAGLRQQIVIENVMHHQPRLGIKQRAMVTALVVDLGIVAHAEQAGHRYEAGLVQNVLRAFRRITYLRFIAAKNDASVILGESFIEPRLRARIIAVQ